METRHRGDKKMFRKMKQEREEKKELAKQQREEEGQMKALILSDKAIYMEDLKTDALNKELTLRGIESPVAIKDDEDIIVAIPSSLYESRAVRTGGYSGTRVRIAKGVSVNVGGFKAESHQELREIDSGTFTLTNKRLVFTGKLKSITIQLGKIVTVQPWGDSAIAITKENVQKVQYFSIPEADLQVSVEDRPYEQPLTGEIMAWIVSGAIKNM